MSENQTAIEPKADKRSTPGNQSTPLIGSTSPEMFADLATLQRVPLFEGLSESDLAQIRALMDARHYAPGQTIIREGERGDDFFVTIKGRTQCVVLDAGGEEIVLDESGVGGFFGELSMLTGEPRSARIKALDEVTALVLDRTEFFQFLQAHPQTAINVLVVLGRRLHRTDSLLRRTVSRNVNEVIEEELTFGQRLAETVASVVGTLWFLGANLLFAIAWIAWNHPHLGGFDFDPYPYGLFGMLLGYEALVISILVLNAQGRQEAKDRIAEEIHHEINKKAEMEIGLILRRLDDLENSVHFASDEQIDILRRSFPTQKHSPAAPASTPQSSSQSTPPAGNRQKTDKPKRNSRRAK